MAKIVERALNVVRYKCEHCGHIHGFSIPLKSFMCSKCGKECRNT